LVVGRFRAKIWALQEGEIMSSSSSAVDPVRKHRREVWLKIVAPVALPFVGLVVLCVLLVIGVAADALVHKQITVVMGVVATAFIAFPLSILCLIPYLVLALGAAGSGRLHAKARQPLRAVRGFSSRVAQTTDRLAPRIARPFIGLNTRLTRWEQVVQSWQQPPALPEQADEKEKTL
jgi:hypothetical protein